MLWLELKKLTLAGIRLAAGLFLALAMLNLGVGAAALVDTQVSTQVSTQSFNFAGVGVHGQDRGRLLHLQFFGLWHVHENLDEAKKAAPGVTEQEDGLAPAPPVRFGYLNHATRMDSDYSNGAFQTGLTDFPGPPLLAGIAARTPLARYPLSDDGPVANPFLKIPLKPPIL